MMARAFIPSLVLALCVLVVLPQGCAPRHHAVMPLGEEALPPIGAKEFCDRKPEDELCRM